MRILVRMCYLLLITFPAYADDNFHASFGCAPWDGRTLELEGGIPDVSVNVSIWAKGLEDLEHGKRLVEINNKEISPGFENATGRARVCGNVASHPCTEEDVTIEFSQLELRESGKVEGRIRSEHNSFVIPFKTIISPLRAMCG